MPEKGIKDWERPIYMIHKHDATNLHYDLRLEFDGMLRSWAVPKGPPESDKKNLAIEVEDHRLEYASFEGTIPEGQYGAGTVEIHDKGTFEVIDEKEKKLVLNIKGEKLNGEYVLVKFKEEKGKSMWLWFKKK